MDAQRPDRQPHFPSPAIVPSHNSAHPTPFHNNTQQGNVASGLDANGVDFRTFFPYIPNEVKHRKRTTQAQLKVLEDLFKTNTKPNAQLRRSLATQLKMTPRGVQVWFQNRRAKEKGLIKKLAANKDAKADSQDQAEDDDQDDSLAKEDSPSSTETEVPAASSAPAPAAIPSPPSVAPANGAERPSSAPHTPPYVSSPASIDSSNSSPLSIPKPFGGSALTEAELLSMRRVSLPTMPLTYTNPSRGPPRLGHIDAPFARRGSVDTSFSRLAGHPYAHIAMAKNDMWSNVAPTSELSPLPELQNFPRITQRPRPNLAHRASMPHALGRPPRASPDGRTVPMSRLNGATRYKLSLPETHPYAVPSRTVPSPLPGPLPNPTFTFGAASTDAESPEQPPPSASFGAPSSFGLPRGSVDELDTEDDSASASYSGLSRFGSIASMASSESSAYLSDAGNCGVDGAGSYDPLGRRVSFTSGPFVAMMSGLGMSNPTAHSSEHDFQQAPPLQNEIGHGTYHSHSHSDIHSMMGAPAPQDGAQPHQRLVMDQHQHQYLAVDQPDVGNYPSPSSTVSPGHSPSPESGLEESSPATSFTMQAPQEQVDSITDTSTIDSYMDPSTDSTYMHATPPESSSSSSSSLSLPIYSQYQPQHDDVPPSANPYASYSMPNLGTGAEHFNVDGTYGQPEKHGHGHGDTVTELQHALDYRYCQPYAYDGASLPVDPAAEAFQAYS